MAFKRGFKAEAQHIAEEVRAEMDLSALDPLDPRRLAEFLDIPVWEMTDLREATAAILHFTATDSAAFSAVTVFRGTRRVIVHNDTHDPGRQASNLAHEIAHSLLRHQPTPAIGNSRAREWNGTLEAEAHWLGAVLLIPDGVAMRVVWNDVDLRMAAQVYGVTPALMKFRVDASAARRRVERSKQSRRAPLAVKNR